MDAIHRMRVPSGRLAGRTLGALSEEELKTLSTRRGRVGSRLALAIDYARARTGLVMMRDAAHRHYDLGDPGLPPPPAQGEPPGVVDHELAAPPLPEPPQAARALVIRRRHDSPTREPRPAQPALRRRSLTLETPPDSWSNSAKKYLAPWKHPLLWLLLAAALYLYPGLVRTPARVVIKINRSIVMRILGACSTFWDELPRKAELLAMGATSSIMDLVDPWATSGDMAVKRKAWVWPSLASAQFSLTTPNHYHHRQVYIRRKLCRDLLLRDVLVMYAKLFWYSSVA
jgi:hypothetical protein